MGWYLFIAPRHPEQPLTASEEQLLSEQIKFLHTYIGWNDSAQCHILQHPEWCATMKFEPVGLRIWWDDWADGWTEDLIQLAGYAHTLGLTVWESEARDKEFTMESMLEFWGRKDETEAEPTD